ncbi:glycerol-3-phosphate 1-acyltransferase [Gloeophyllum trabeum ATCC 11539]|uniref:Glycerol-3-phosphate 1-acyltransferase n=1 Tax=Gloeophyllum trabeum (strain ATCC 11539 / FP-39264 / Madison 617) TaxID=670483 RepID=S7PV17_GLOTA|nr:glycerol-3-phosphate 1-acyltransferase [Gloeophyllum trabeum ATCC 11539]EPQ51328.1 glycerol-3-phosphate 1-acyltransferase [Gloeophyllum trabeum ATCC 11539]
MELKLVYRALRKISDWALSEFYSEVYVEGQHNVPEAGPLIIVASHHNEMIDIATLAATIPYRRHLCFWAKSTMFKNPLSRVILTSSGAIPVYRNPNSNSAARTPSAKSLFDSTSETLAKGEVIGVFPEGTSYTEPRIAQVKEGAAWAAVEYVRWAKEHGRDGTDLVIVPVGIVYTDKSKYQSRLTFFRRYGEPIRLSPYSQPIPALEGSNNDSEEDARRIVKELTAEIEKRIIELTVNAPDWDTLYVSRMARDLLWPRDTDIPLKDFVGTSQRCVQAGGRRCRTTGPTTQIKQALLKYYSLLHYTGLDHTTLSSILPSPSPGTDERAPLLPANTPGTSLVTARSALRIFVCNALVTFLYPRFILFLPPFVVHIPAYVMGKLAARFLATPGEEEGIAQYKTIVGGEVLGTITTAYVVGWALRLVASYKLLGGLLSPRASDVSPAELPHYCTPPPPVVNPFIKRRPVDGQVPQVPSAWNEVKPVSSRRLMRHLLAARAEAAEALRRYPVSPVTVSH